MKVPGAITASDGTPSSSRVGRVVGAALALALVAGVLMVARPQEVWRLLRATDPGWLALAATVSAVAVIARGIRLSLLLPPSRLGGGRAVVVAAAAQAAALFIPARAGEMALPLLLRRVARWDLASGVSTLLAARTLDLACLGVWAGVSVLGVWGWKRPAVLFGALALLLPPLLLPLSLAALDRIAVTCLAPLGMRSRRWARRVRRTRSAMVDIVQRPGRLLAAAVASLAMWGAVWVFTWLLLVAMGYRWPLTQVVGGSAAASLANLVPVNLVANLGTLEAGWTAAFTALGVPLERAAASGLAAHLWALIIAAIFGGVAWAVVGRMKVEG